MKKLIALVLALCAMLALVSCGGNDTTVPDGYKLASNSELCSYSLFVPETWIAQSDRTDYTIAAVSSTDSCSVSMANIEGDNLYGVTTVADYWEHCKTQYTFLGDFAVSEEGTQVAFGADGHQGWRYRFTGTYNGTTYAYMQVFVIARDAFYCFTYTATAEDYDAHLTLVNEILSYIRLR